MIPVQVNSYSEFINIFGDPVPGEDTTTDKWRAGIPDGPTYASYAAKAWLNAGTAPATIVRLLGEEHSSAGTSGLAGWTTTKDPVSSSTNNTNGGAFGLFIIDSGSATSHNTGTLSAIWYVDSGSVLTLSGADVDGNQVSAAGCLIKSYGSTAANVFKLSLWNGKTLAKEFGSANFGDSSATSWSRNMFNTSPAMTNTEITDTSSLSDYEHKYWLGETFERATQTYCTGGAGEQWGMILPLMSASAAGYHDRKAPATNSQTGWFFSQDFGPTGSFIAESSGPQRLFKFHALDYGAWPNSNIKIAIEDIRAATTSTSWGTFTVAVYPADAKSTTVDSTALERFTGCTLNKNSKDYVEKKIGNKLYTWSYANKKHTAEGPDDADVVYGNKSQYVRIEMNDKISFNQSAVPFGVTGPIRSVGFSWFASDDPGVVAATATITVDEVTHFTDEQTFIITDTAGTAHTFTIETGDDLVADNKVGLAGAAAAGGSAGNNAAAVKIAAAINDATSTCAATITATSADAVVTLTQDVAGAAGNTTITPTAKGTDATFGNFSGGDWSRTSNLQGQTTTATVLAGTPTNGYVLWGTGNIAQHHASHTSGAIFLRASSGPDFSGSWVFPATAVRGNSDEGFSGLGAAAYFGVDHRISAASPSPDQGYGEYNIGLPFGSTARGRFDTLTGAPAGTEYQWVFSLDNLSGASGVGPFYDLSGSRAAGTSISAVNDDYAMVLDEGLRQFWAPMYGGHDGLDITEKEPFRNSQWSSPTNLTSYSYNSIDKALDSIADAEVLEYNLMTIPGITQNDITNKMISTCETRADALAIIDLDGGYVPSTENKDTFSDRLGSVSTTTSNKAARTIDTSYACAYYPWVQVEDPKTSRLLYVPPSVIALGTFGNSEALSELWYAPAGFNRGGLKSGGAGLTVTDVVERVTSSDRDKLYDHDINPIAKFPSEGIVVYGQKTLWEGGGVGAAGSALDRINVRRLMIYIKKEVSRIAATILFDQNNSVTWARFTGEVNPFLSDIQARYGLSDYRVVLDETTTTAHEIDNNIMYAQIYLKPQRAIEYIALDFIIASTGASFAD
jgi:hypothetical protein